MRKKKPCNLCLCSMCIFLLALASAILLSGCATAWEDKKVRRTVETALLVESIPKGTVYINNKNIGETPLTVPLQYERWWSVKTRKVSLWRSEPGSTFASCVITFGMFLPFTFSANNEEYSSEPTAEFAGNQFSVRITAKGYRDWQETITVKGEGKVSLCPTLEKGGG